jgi:hypothetical protein
MDSQGPSKPIAVQGAGRFATRGGSRWPILFGELGYPRLNVARIIGREKMKKSKLFQEIQTEERRETRRADILRFLTARFGPAGIPEVAAALHEVEEPEMLDRFIDRAATCASVAEFRDALLQR